MKVEWTTRAKKDLRRLYEYYRDESDSDAFAKSMTSHIVKRSLSLEQFPLMGPIEENLPRKQFIYRSLIAGNQKIIYWIEGETVFIATLFDCRQDPSKLNKRLE